MSNEIERKFFVKVMPDLSNVKPIRYERYFLERAGGKEVRVSKIDGRYVYEEKLSVSSLERTRTSREIPKEEFESLLQKASDIIVRDRYDISAHPKISIQVYHGQFKGLIRAEVEFESREAAEKFIPFSWMGKEMTDLPIARDANLLDLTKEQFTSCLS